MKKRFVTLSAFVFCLFAAAMLSACTPAAGQNIDIENVRIEKGRISWDPVENATRYDVKINGRKFTSSLNEIDISEFDKQECEISIQALSNGKPAARPYSEATLIYDGYRAETEAYGQFDDIAKKEAFLGYGFDVINSNNFSDRSVLMSYPIFDMNKLLSQRLIKVDSKQSFIEEISGGTIAEFMDSWNAKANVAVSWGGKHIGGSVEAAADYAAGTGKSAYSYFYALSIFDQEFYLVMQGDNNDYRSILSKGFKQDLYDSSVTPETLIRKYGSHFLTSAVMGGKIDSLYRLSSEENSNFNSVVAKINVSVKYMVGQTSVGGEGGYNDLAQSQNIDVKNKLKIFGGSDLGIFNDSQIQDNYNAWEQSLSERPSLIGIKDTSSITPVWELIDPNLDQKSDFAWEDPDGALKTGTRREQLQGYFYQYGVENYNSLMAAEGLPGLIAPDRIANIKINDKQIQAGDTVEVKSGSANKITFNVLPTRAVGFSQEISVDKPQYAQIEKDTLTISPDTPHGIVITVRLSSGNVSETFCLKVNKTCQILYVPGWSGQESYSEEAIYGQAIDFFPPKEREGFTFLGWYELANHQHRIFDFENSCILADLTLYGKWEVKTLTIRFYDTETKVYETQTLPFDSKAAPPEKPAREGFIFKGWYEDADTTLPFDFSVSLKYDIDLYAKWEPVKVTVSFFVGDDYYLPDLSLDYGAVIGHVDVPASASGRIFSGWFEDKEYNLFFDVSNTPVYKDILLYAKWITNFVQVRFNTNFVDITLEPISLEAGGSLKTLLPLPKKEGYLFLGWYSDAGFNEQAKVDGQTVISVDTVLFAKWQKQFEDYDYINSPQDFYQMKKTGRYLLVTDLQLYNHTPFAFDGVFDGNGHTISYTMMSADTAVDYYGGLFSQSTGGSFANIKLNVKFSRERPGKYNGFVGGLLGTASKVKVSNVAVYGNIAVLNLDGNGYVGGLIGKLYGGDINGCKNAAFIVNADRSSRTGGIAGYVQASDSPVTINNCYNEGKLEAGSNYLAIAGGCRFVGGIIGQINAIKNFQTVTVGYCYNNGELLLNWYQTGRGPSSKGGIIGDFQDGNKQNYQLQSCYWNTSKSPNPVGFSNTHAGTIGKVNMKGYLTGWDLKIWKFSNNDAPRLIALD